MSKERESVFAFGDRGPEKLSYPISCIPYKNMFLVCDGGNQCIKVFHQPGTFLYKFGKEGNQDGELNWPYYLLVDSSDNLRDTDNDRVQQFSLDGRFTGESITRLPDDLFRKFQNLQFVTCGRMHGITHKENNYSPLPLPPPTNES